MFEYIFSLYMNPMDYFSYTTKKKKNHLNKLKLLLEVFMENLGES